MGFFSSVLFIYKCVFCTFFIHCMIVICNHTGKKKDTKREVELNFRDCLITFPFFSIGNITSIYDFFPVANGCHWTNQIHNLRYHCVIYWNIAEDDTAVGQTMTQRSQLWRKSKVYGQQKLTIAGPPTEIKSIDWQGRDQEAAFFI